MRNDLAAFLFYCITNRIECGDDARIGMNGVIAGLFDMEVFLGCVFFNAIWYGINACAKSVV